MSEFKLNGKTILITGASSGIGSAAAIRCAGAGANIILHGRDEKKLRHVSEQLGKNCQKIICADISSEEGIKKVLSEIGTGELDGVVHSAGIVKPSAIKFISRKQIDETFQINFYAPVILTSGLLSANKIKHGASFVFISSVSSQHPYTGGALYTSSKAALEAFSRGLALEHASKKIRSNCIAPAMVRTPMMEQFDQEGMESHGEHYLLGFGKPENVADSVLYLLSDASEWITGTTIILDGGLLISNKK